MCVCECVSEWGGDPSTVTSSAEERMPRPVLGCGKPLKEEEEEVEEWIHLFSCYHNKSIPVPIIRYDDAIVTAAFTTCAAITNTTGRIHQRCIEEDASTEFPRNTGQKGGGHIPRIPLAGAPPPVKLEPQQMKSKPGSSPSDAREIEIKERGLPFSLKKRIQSVQDLILHVIKILLIAINSDLIVRVYFPPSRGRERSGFEPHWGYNCPLPHPQHPVLSKWAITP